MSRSTGKGMLARVQLDPLLHSSLVHLPISLHAPLIERNVAPQNIVVELTVQGKDGKEGAKYYCGWSGRSAAPLPASEAIAQSSNSAASAVPSASVICISPALANSFQPVLRTKDGSELVRITLLRSPPLPVASRVDVSPLDADDWEILGTYAEAIELNLLEQCRAACKGMILVVFAGKGGRTTCRFRVDSTDPPTRSIAPDSSQNEDGASTSSRAVRLSTDTELIIAPKPRASHQPTEQPPEDLDLTSNQSARLQAISQKSIEELADRSVSVPEARLVLRRMLYRVMPSLYGPKAVPRTIANGAADGSHPSRSSSAAWADKLVLLDSQSYELLAKTFSTFRCSVTKVPCPNGSNTSSIENALRSDAKANGKSKESEGDDRVEEEGDSSDMEWDESTSSVSVSEGDDSGQSQDGSQLPERPTVGAAFIDGEAYMFGADGAQWPRRHVWLGSEVRKSLGVQDYDLVFFSAPSPATSAQISKLEVPIHSALVNVNGAGPLGQREKRRLAGVDTVLAQCASVVRNTFLSRSLFQCIETSKRSGKSGKSRVFGPIPSGMLITGGAGAGKTSVAKGVLRQLSLPADPSGLTPLVAPHFVDCAAYSEERVPALRALFQSWLNAATWNAPSVLVLDNVDRLVPAEQEHSDGSRNRQLAENLISRIKQTVAESDVFVILTAQSTTAVHALLNGSHIFAETVQLKAPPKETRREILEFLVQKKLTLGALEQEGLNFVTLSTQTEGYLPADLQDLIERAVHEAAIHASTSTAAQQYASSPMVLSLTMQDFAKAQEGFTPLSLRDVKLEKSETSWSDIGGLVETRRILRETLEWPTKYAAIFANCPLRLRSGLLLYGYPGCGKTLLASAVAKECGLNFISVKGPEILNKYIGASEKSVRDLFDRAQAAKPCVLFFDEFDSIAPKRGHDSTGVTDRVVNQLLTQMDGAEGLNGVYVLAATSRPDLIDSALLRPGRLDKSLLCDMPSEEDRLDIMRAVSQKVKLHPDVDLKEWAKRTEGFSGADLQALLYNAHLETIHESINNTKLVSSNGNIASKKDGEQNDVRFVCVGGGDNDAHSRLSGAQHQALSRRLALMLDNSLPKKESLSNGVARANGLSVAQDEVVRESVPIEGKRLVTSEHLQRSLKATRPSVPADEQRRLQRIYSAFAGERDGKFPDGEASQKIGARESLM
ncbi:AAA-domain-containing protein [Tilletiaria anomala UBC 951]|uniref:Peroxisomal ATPase PEX1 n=1 Tax=Tilletiaria anomala (strain ATCC 24038 / CBS 436.72 / UBC 951) TaxID=1037660 RepID=A0A066VXC8_TILAU|nr:AAA-domain-containing protein [Tilletiaria anomala UBC 951]KDN44933.1 AAA-domain-containing protein [Tilletiaria anomala UBC 951]